MGPGPTSEEVKRKAMNRIIEIEPRGNVIRWAVGSPSGLRSSTWRLWGNKKGDIYAAVRDLGGRAKASFHRDGKCHVGFTGNYAPTAARRFGVASRHWQKWRLPADPVVRVLQVLVPDSELRSFAERNPRDITWLPTPPEGSVAVVSIFVSAQGNELPLRRVDHSVIAIGNLQVSTRTAWVVYAHNPIDATMATLIASERAKLTCIPGAARWPRGTRATLWESREDHNRHALELAVR